MSADTPSGTNSIDNILRGASDGIFVIDHSRRFTLFNAACERITGLKLADLVDSDCLCYENLNCYDESGQPLTPERCPLKKLFDGDAESLRQRIRIRRGDGSQLWIDTAYSSIRNGSGEVDCVLGVMRDVTGTKAREDYLQNELSGLREKLQHIAEKKAAGITPAGQDSLLLDQILAQVEREAIQRALRTANWQRNKAARLMGISRSRLYRRMEALGIDPNEHP